MILEILAIVAEFGGPAVLILLAAFVFWKLVTMKPKNEVTPAKKVNVKIDNKKELKVHPLFKNARYRISVEIPILNLVADKPVKQQIIRDLLLIETQVTYDVCMDFVNNVDVEALDVDNTDSTEWIAEITSLLDNIMIKFLDRCKSEGIPDEVVVKFNKWKHHSFNALYSYADTFGRSKAYQTNLARTNTFYHILNLMLITTLADAERTLKELNGDISGKTYKGKVIEA